MIRSRATTLLLAATLSHLACGGGSSAKRSGAGGGWSGGGAGGSGGAAGSAGSNQGDKFDAPGTNPFVATRHDPRSTFAADVDTASYDVFRRDVKNGQAPRPESVRLEDFVNYFDYGYQAPSADAEAPFAITLAAAANALDRPTTLLRVGIQAVEPPPFEKRPAHVVFLVDVSGSMQSSDKLPLVKQVLSQTLDVLDPTDEVSIVTYASGTDVPLHHTAVANRSAIVRAINELSAGGSTAGAAGLALAYDEAKAAFKEGGINHVVLCTDGDFNVGPSSNKELLALIREKRTTGVTLTALGFGVGNLNDAMMEAVSNAGNGMYAVIADAAQAERYVHERMLSTLVHVARDLKIQVEFNPEKVYAYRLLGYENRAIADDDFRNDGIDAGEVGAGHRVTALYELVLDPAALPSPTGAPALEDGSAPSDFTPEVAADDLVLVKVRWKPVDVPDPVAALETNASLGAGAALESLDAGDQDLQWASAVAAFAEIVKGSPYADVGLLPQIARIATTQAFRDDDRDEFATLLMRWRAITGK